ncbi:PA2169 family four-helix-bundle protein [Sphingobium sp. CR2-8]|uniref:ferritin-like domain-containing protein n=1 Tax=Sphingobium sp. CR2-8 TaxID=1306534 RepID=UPI002DBC9570|nr:PA2169 family four-helix-bundle protein [Sphingobium sp. CR2-8]MEC3911701.1 PA2169 family four-helix-bundle protein [Sphingobium sp. CR2-8]
MSNNHAVSKLDDLITTLIDSVKGYEHSADKVDSVDFQTLFRNLAIERTQAVDLLQARSRALGGKPNAFGSMAGTVHRRMEDIFVALGGGDKAVVQAIDRGEDYLREEFERVLNDSAIDEETLAVVRRAHDSVAHGQVVVTSLKDQLAAA